MTSRGRAGREIMERIHFQIDGKAASGEPGETVLTVARRLGIPIPTLCHHEALEDWGGCRLCLVEITHPDWRGWKGLVTSCLYPIEPGLQVSTSSPEVVATRRTILDLLLARCPEAEPIQKLAAEYGVEKTSFVPREGADNCILCALCTRVCAELGHHAISTVQRGARKEIGTPLGEPPEDCVGCLVCAKICPTGVIGWDERGGRRQIWGRDFEMMSCTGCGTAHVTRSQAEFICRREGLTMDYFEKCDACRARETAATFSRMVKWR